MSPGAGIAQVNVKERREPGAPSGQWSSMVIDRPPVSFLESGVGGDCMVPQVRVRSLDDNLGGGRTRRGQ